MKINWLRTIYGPPNGRGWHVHSLVQWKGAYYIAFADGAGHTTDDSRVRIAVSKDLEHWSTYVALGREQTGMYVSEPQLMAVGDRLYLYATKTDFSFEYEFPPHSRHPKSPSWEVMSYSDDGRTWSPPKQCYTMNYDFWHPTQHNGRYYITCDGSGHTPEGVYTTVDLLTTEDGQRWTWVSEIVHGTVMPGDPESDYPQAPYVSESAILVMDDETMLAVTRTPGPTAIVSTARPPYEIWSHKRTPRYIMQGAALARVGPHIVATARCGERERDGKFANSFSDLDSTGTRTGIYVYEDGDLHLKGVLPSGGDTGYGGIWPVSDKEFLVAYYSTHEYAEHSGSNVYLASVTIE